MVTLPPRLVSTDLGTCSYQCFASNCTPVSLHMLKCRCAIIIIIIIVTIMFPVFGGKKCRFFIS
jgi:hypothetical protein